MRLYPWILAIRALNRHPLLFWVILIAVLYLLGEMKPIPH
jgi:hypothetical protein